MRSRWTALAFVLVLAGLAPRESKAQGAPPQTPPRKPTGGLSQNYPNPFNPETDIGFTVGDPPACTDSKPHVVTIKIFNALAQVYAIPQIMVGPGVAGGQQVNKLTLYCGSFKAHWDGYVMGTKRKAASGGYLYSLEIDGREVARKRMMITK